MILYRYFMINQGVPPQDAIANPQDDSLAPSQWASQLYFLQENLKDQWVDAIQPLGMDQQLIDSWNLIMTTAQRSYNMNVHNIIVAMAILGRAIYAYFPQIKNTWVNFRPGGAGGEHATVLEFSGSPISQFSTGTVNGTQIGFYDSADGLDAYDLPSVNQSNIPASVTEFYAAYEQMLSVSPTIAQVRAYLDNLDLPGVMNDILGYLQMQNVLRDPNGYKYPFYKQMAEYAYGTPIERYLYVVDGQWTAPYGQNAATDTEIFTYCSGSNLTAQQDAAQALAQMDAVQQDMYNFAGQLNAFVNAPNAPSALQAQLQKENTMQTWSIKPAQIIPARSSSPPLTYNVKPAIQTLPEQIVGTIKNAEISGTPVMPPQTVVHPGGTPGNLGVIHAANVAHNIQPQTSSDPAVAPTSSHVAAGNVTHRNTPTVSAAAGSQNAASAPAAATVHHVASMGLLVAAAVAMMFLI